MEQAVADLIRDFPLVVDAASRAAFTQGVVGLVATILIFFVPAVVLAALAIWPTEIFAFDDSRYFAALLALGLLVIGVLVLTQVLPMVIDPVGWAALEFIRR